MALLGVFNAAKAGTYATGHLVLERYLARYAGSFGPTGYGYHHRLGTAGVYLVKLLASEH